MLPTPHTHTHFSSPSSHFHSHLFSGEFVAQFKFTVLLMANGPLRITSSLFEPELYQSEHDVEDPELKVRLLHKHSCVQTYVVLHLISVLFLKVLLQSSASRKAQKKKKKKVTLLFCFVFSSFLNIFSNSFLNFYFISVTTGFKNRRECDRTGDGDRSCRVNFNKRWQEPDEPKEQTSRFFLSRLSEGLEGV